MLKEPLAVPRRPAEDLVSGGWSTLPTSPTFTGQGTTLSPATVTWDTRVLPSFLKVLRIWGDTTHPPDQSKLTGPLVPGHATYGQGQWDMPTHPLLVPTPLHSFKKCF